MLIEVVRPPMMFNRVSRFKFLYNPAMHFSAECRKATQDDIPVPLSFHSLRSVSNLNNFALILKSTISSSS
jgi:hypothetical protein